MSCDRGLDCASFCENDNVLVRTGSRDSSYSIMHHEYLYSVSRILSPVSHLFPSPTQCVLVRIGGRVRAYVLHVLYET